jgi:uncharacterized protein with beta-barrel porin domain
MRINRKHLLLASSSIIALGLAITGNASAQTTVITSTTTNSTPLSGTGTTPSTGTVVINAGTFNVINNSTIANSGGGTNGTIANSGNAVSVDGVLIGTITNNGLIEQTGGTAGDSSHAMQVLTDNGGNGGITGGLINTGTITSNGNKGALGFGTVTNTTLTNSGTIANTGTGSAVGFGSAIANVIGVTVNNTIGGVIESQNAPAIGTPGTLTGNISNSGIIVSRTGNAISIGTFVANTITGGTAFGGLLSGGNVGTITNTGTIANGAVLSGGVLVPVAVSGGNSAISVAAGTIINSGASALIISNEHNAIGFSGTMVGSIINSGTISSVAGGTNNHAIGLTGGITGGITNSGLITANGISGAIGFGDGAGTNGPAISITNNGNGVGVGTGTISNTGGGNAIGLGTAGNSASVVGINITNGGTIIAAGSAGNGIGSSGTITGTITNSGTITSNGSNFDSSHTSDGINVVGGINGSIINSGLISSSTTLGDAINIGAGTIINNSGGTISSAQGHAINLGSGNVGNGAETGGITNNSGATITSAAGNTFAIVADGPLTGNITNYGLISQTGGNIVGGNAGAIGLFNGLTGGITNVGTITSNGTGTITNQVNNLAFLSPTLGIANGNANITNATLGLIQSTGAAANAIAFGAATTSTIDNHGTISAAGSGSDIYLGGLMTGSISNENGGTISNSGVGNAIISTSGISGGIVNSGLISSVGSVIVSGGSTNITNGGTISAGSPSGTAIDFSTASSNSTITNNLGGTITGAIKTSSYSDVLNLNGGAINGAVSVNNGVLNLNGGSITGNTTIGNGGTLNQLAASSTLTGSLSTSNATVNLSANNLAITSTVTAAGGVFDVGIGAGNHGCLTDTAAGNNFSGLTIAPVYTSAPVTTGETLVFVSGGSSTTSNVAVSQPNPTAVIWSLGTATSSGIDAQGYAYQSGALLLTAQAPTPVSGTNTIGTVSSGAPVTVTGGTPTISQVASGGIVAVTSGTPTISQVASGGSVSVNSGTPSITTVASGATVSVTGGTATVGTVQDAVINVSSGGNATVTQVGGASALTVGTGSTVAVSNLATTSGGSVSIGSGATVSAGTTSSTFDGTLSGGGTLQKTGAGTLTLGSTAAVSTSLAVQQGTVAVTSGASITAPVTVTSGGNMVINSGATIVNTQTMAVSGGDMTVSGNLTAPLTVSNGGTLTVSNNATVSSSTPLAISGNSSLAISGTVDAPVTVASGGDLGGSGTINGNVTIGSGGILSPGHSPATTNITGAVTQMSGSTLSLDIDGPTTGTGAGHYSSVAITGSYAISAGATIQVNLRNITGAATNSYSPAIGTEFTVVTATAGVTGTFGTLVQPTGIGTRFGVLYTADAVELVVTSAGLAALPPVAANAGSVNAIANYTGSNSHLLSLQTAVLNLTSPADINKAGAQLRPAVNGGQTSGAMQATVQVFNLIGSHNDQINMAATHGTGVSAGEAPLGLGVWGQAFGFLGDQAASGGIDGYQASTGGFAIGGDSAVNSSTRVGLALSWANTGISDKGDTSGSSARIGSTQGSVYSNFANGPWSLNGMFGLTYHDFRTTRLVDMTGYSDTAYGHFDGWQYSGRVNGGYSIPLGDKAVVTPTAGLTYSYLTQASYSETSNGGSALTVASSSTDSLKSTLGGKLDKSFDAGSYEMTGEFRSSWQHEYRNTAQQVTAQFATDSANFAAGSGFTATGAAPGRDSALIGLSMGLNTASDVKASLNYDTELRGGYNGQTATLQIRTEF